MKTAGDERRLRVAVLIRRFISTAGAEKYCVEVTRRIAERHEVHVFAQEIGEGPIPGVTYHRIEQRVRKPRFLNQWLFARDTRKAVGEGFDIVHSHDVLGHANVYTLHVPCFRNRYREAPPLRRLGRWLGTLFSPRELSYLWLEAMQFSPRRRAKRFIAVSGYMRRSILQSYPSAAPGLATAYPGLDCDGIPARSEETRRTARTGLQVPTDAFALLFVANDFRKKGLDSLVQALARLDSAPLLLVAGSGQRKVYDELIARLGLGGRVRFLGPQTDLSPCFAAADALVHPTRVDTFGMAVLEAMAYGLPVIVSDPTYCGVAERFSQDDALLLTNPQDPDEIARRIGELMADDALRSRLSKNGLAFARSASWSATAEATLDVYRSLTASGAPAS